MRLHRLFRNRGEFDDHAALAHRLGDALEDLDDAPGFAAEEGGEADRHDHPDLGGALVHRRQGARRSHRKGAVDDGDQRMTVRLRVGNLADHGTAAGVELRTTDDMGKRVPGRCPRRPEQGLDGQLRAVRLFRRRAAAAAGRPAGLRTGLRAGLFGGRRGEVELAPPLGVDLATFAPQQLFPFWFGEGAPGATLGCTSAGLDKGRHLVRIEGAVAGGEVVGPGHHHHLGNLHFLEAVAEETGADGVDDDGRAVPALGLRGAGEAHIETASLVEAAPLQRSQILLEQVLAGLHEGRREAPAAAADHFVNRGEIEDVDHVPLVAPAAAENLVRDQGLELLLADPLDVRCQRLVDVFGGFLFLGLQRLDQFPKKLAHDAPLISVAPCPAVLLRQLGKKTAPHKTPAAPPHRLSTFFLNFRNRAKNRGFREENSDNDFSQSTGAEGEIRTPALLITNQLLCR